MCLKRRWKFLGTKRALNSISNGVLTPDMQCQCSAVAATACWCLRVSDRTARVTWTHTPRHTGSHAATKQAMEQRAEKIPGPCAPHWRGTRTRTSSAPSRLERTRFDRSPAVGSRPANRHGRPGSEVTAAGPDGSPGNAIRPCSGGSRRGSVLSLCRTCLILRCSY